MTKPAILWFRRDLRLGDNPALVAAAADGPIIPLFILDDEAPGDFAIGAAQRWWLHHSLKALDAQLDGRLLLRRGKSADIIRELAKECGSGSIHANRLLEPWNRALEGALEDEVTFHDPETLVPPGEVCTTSGTHYKVYGAFWKALSDRLPPPEPTNAPDDVAFAEHGGGESLDDWGLLPTRPNWAAEFGDHWTPGEEGALARLDEWTGEVGDYPATRNLPSQDGTSRLSPHLHMGEVSPRRVWHALDLKGGAKFLKELAWRDFSRSAMLADPAIGWETGRDAMKRLQWRDGEDADRDFAAWTKGQTGYPIVDAGMRQLWRIGWMHNRVRMLTASFLSKHLLIDWRRGAMWFWDCLVDADYGNNNVNWQWIAGTGTASQNFSRIMAPLSQSEKFDAAGYIREWVPELRDLDDEAIHDPPAELRGEYPEKIVGHQQGRERALDALARARSS